MAASKCWSPSSLSVRRGERLEPAERGIGICRPFREGVPGDLEREAEVVVEFFV